MVSDKVVLIVVDCSFLNEFSYVSYNSHVAVFVVALEKET